MEGGREEGSRGGARVNVSPGEGRTRKMTGCQCWLTFLPRASLPDGFFKISESEDGNGGEKEGLRLRCGA